VSSELTTPPVPRPTPDANLGYLFRLAHQRFRGALDDELHDLGLSAQEYGVLSVFAARPELSTSELARIAQVSRQSMHAEVLRLESAGLVERRARNQRAVLVRLTRRGRGRLEAATERVRPVEAATLADLTQGEERVVRSWLARMASAPIAPRLEGPRARSAG
jgi:DNA-binding MarR family transcriptional regulator